MEVKAADDSLLELFLQGALIAAELIAEEHEVDMSKFATRYRLIVELADNLDQVFGKLLIQLRQSANAGSTPEELSKILWVAARQHAVGTLKRSGLFGPV